LKKTLLFLLLTIKLDVFAQVKMSEYYRKDGRYVEPRYTQSRYKLREMHSHSYHNRQNFPPIETITKGRERKGIGFILISASIIAGILMIKK
jgi:hypothetical protein